MKSKAKWAVLALVVFAVVRLWYVESFGEPAFIRVNRAKTAVVATLSDGDSAKFRNVRAINSIEVCGEVNAKNRFGGYTGFTKFSVAGNDKEPIVTMNEQAVEIFCH